MYWAVPAILTGQCAKNKIGWDIRQTLRNPVPGKHASISLKRLNSIRIAVHSPWTHSYFWFSCSCQKWDFCAVRSFAISMADLVEGTPQETLENASLLVVTRSLGGMSEGLKPFPSADQSIISVSIRNVYHAWMMARLSMNFNHSWKTNTWMQLVKLERAVHTRRWRTWKDSV